MNPEDALLRGALDLHAHGYPEFTLKLRPRVSNIQWAELAIAASMRGFVMKSHFWPTTAPVEMLRSLFPVLETFASITLNPPVGGVNPFSVEVAAQSGAKVVWMPTWSARRSGAGSSIYNDRMRQHLKTLHHVETAPSYDLDVVDDTGRLTNAARRIVEICHEYDLTIASGHLPISSSIALAKEASAQSVRFILTHPQSGSVQASIEDQRAIVELGGFVEHVFIASMPMHQRANPRVIAEAIDAVGAQNCIMASDAIEGWNPPPPEVLRMFISSMMAMGISEDAIYAMTHTNPARALGIPEERTYDD